MTHINRSRCHAGIYDNMVCVTIDIKPKLTVELCKKLCITSSFCYEIPEDYKVVLLFVPLVQHHV